MDHNKKKKKLVIEWGFSKSIELNYAFLNLLKNGLYGTIMKMDLKFAYYGYYFDK